MSAQQVGVPTVSIRGWSKTFAGRTVLHDVDLDVFAGEIHGLVGQNGSGKSTLIKILSAFHSPDPGATLAIRGHSVSMPLRVRDPADFGISFVHQDLGLFDRATVVENVGMGQYGTGPLWRISWRRERRKVLAALRTFDVRVQPQALVSSLEPVDKARVAIVRALERLAGVQQGLLVLDEPTPHLPRDGVDRLFDTIRSISAAGVAVLFVTHRLDEIRELTHTVTVLRDGYRVTTSPTASLSDDEIRSRLLGFSLDRLYPGIASRVDSDSAISIRKLSGSRIRDFDLDVRRGEIVGLTGLLQQGWEEVPYVVFGAVRGNTGRVSASGPWRDLASLSPAQAMADGLALVPASRLEEGAVGTASVMENVTLPTLGREFIRGWLRHRQEMERTRQLLEAFDVRPREPNRMFSTLSGGNQQKVVLAKWFETEPKVLLLHEPTQGVDVGARSQIYKRLREAALSGLAVIIASAEFEDLAHVCDRVIVFRDGRPKAELTGPSLTYERILDESFGQGRDGQDNGTSLPEQGVQADTVREP
jgi:ribose transport system ATP-binding protein